jgi:WD40 repeat protein
MRSIAFSPDDRLLVGGGRNGRLRVWDLQAGRELTTFAAHAQRIRDVTFDSAGTNLISVGEDRTVRVWNATGWSEQCRLAGVSGKVFSLAHLSHDRLATACSDNLIRIWDLRRRELVSQLRGHQGSVAALDANDRWLVSGSFDGTVRIWPIDEIDRTLSTLREQQSADKSGAAGDAETQPTSITPVD